MPTERVYQVQHIALVEGTYQQAITDLIFRDGIPIAVLTWAAPQDREYPLEIVRLDPERLNEFHSGVVDYLDDGVIEVPPPAF